MTGEGQSRAAEDGVVAGAGGVAGGGGPMAWYCLQAQVKREHIAAAAVRARAGLESFCPRVSFHKKTRRGKVKFVEALFPGYLFVRCEIACSYRHLLAMEGVRRVVRYGDRFAEVPNAFIEDIRKELAAAREEAPEEETFDEPEASLALGGEVVVLEGPLLDIKAIVSGIVPAQQRVQVLLEFLGRQIEVELPRSAVMATERAPHRFSAGRSGGDGPPDGDGEGAGGGAPGG